MSDAGAEALKHVEWAELIEHALTAPGSLGRTYSRFHDYSFGNMVLLLMQGVNEPVAGLRRWNDMGRRVIKGSRAKTIMVPLKGKVEDERGDQHMVLRGFKFAKCLFGLSQTEGEPVPEVEPAEWSRARALGALAIREVGFESTDGNTQGYSQERNIAINPVAAYPMKTTLHEISHVLAGHTAAGSGYAEHRGVAEFVAEGSAYLCMNELGLQDEMDAAESRAYIQHWLRDERPEDKHIRQVFSVTDQILKAGRTA